MWVFSCFLLHKIWADSGWQQLCALLHFLLSTLDHPPPSNWLQQLLISPQLPNIRHSSQWSLRCFKIAMLRDASQRLYEEPNHTHLMLQDCYVPPRKMSLWRILWDSLGGILVRSISMATTLTISTFWKWVLFNFVIVYIFVCVYFKLKIEYFFIFSAWKVLVLTQIGQSRISELLVPKETRLMHWLSSFLKKGVSISIIIFSIIILFRFTFYLGTVSSAPCSRFVGTFSCQKAWTACPAQEGPLTAWWCRLKEQTPGLKGKKIKFEYNAM